MPLALDKLLACYSHEECNYSRYPQQLFCSTFLASPDCRLTRYHTPSLSSPPRDSRPQIAGSCAAAARRPPGCEDTTRNPADCVVLNSGDPCVQPMHQHFSSVCITYPKDLTRQKPCKTALPKRCLQLSQGPFREHRPPSSPAQSKNSTALLGSMELGWSTYGLCVCSLHM